MYFRFVHLPDEHAGGHFLVADGRHGSVIHPSFWLIPLTLSPYLDAREGIGLLETNLMDCWPRLDPMNWMNEQELPIPLGERDRLIVDEASHVADVTFYLDFPTDGANCCLSDSRSPQIVGA